MGCLPGKSGYPETESGVMRGSRGSTPRSAAPQTPPTLTPPRSPLGRLALGIPPRRELPAPSAPRAAHLMGLAAQRRNHPAGAMTRGARASIRIERASAHHSRHDSGARADPPRRATRRPPRDARPAAEHETRDPRPTTHDQTSSRAALIAPTGAGTPVNSSKLSAPWPTSRASPSTTGIERSRAARTSAVSRPP